MLHIVKQMLIQALAAYLVRISCGDSAESKWVWQASALYLVMGAAFALIAVVLFKMSEARHLSSTACWLVGALGLVPVINVLALMIMGWIPKE